MDVHCSIYNNEYYGSYAESLPALDELLASSLDPDISGNDDEVM